MSEENPPRVSVVIPTAGRPGLLDRCLQALLAQTLLATQFEVIVVDDGPHPSTERLVTLLAARSTTQPPIRCLSTGGGRGPAAARNVGWRAARGAIIAFTDDDCVPAPKWLAAGLEAMREGIAGATGRIVVPLGPAPTDYELNVAGLEGAVFATANCFYRREALGEAGGFDERFTMAWREDADLYLSLLEGGRHLVDALQAVVVHPVRPAPWGVSLSQQRKSYFNALLYRKHRASYWERIQPSPPWQYYRAVLASVLCLFLVARGQRRASTGAGVIWAIETAQFSALRLRRTSRSPEHIAEMVLTSLLIPFLAVAWRLAGAIRFRVLFL